MTQTSPVAWYAAFPAPVASPLWTSPDELHRHLLSEDPDKETHLLVDSRRFDFDTAFIPGAISLNPHSFYCTLPSLLPILSQYNRVIFYCQKSFNRSPRLAAWYQDSLNQAGIPSEQSRAEVLVGGLQKWIAIYGEDDPRLVTKLTKHPNGETVLAD
ncbi:hypothetical protein T439DRAFT_328631 [Meredithblackwellia eburnea MCA 4105]